MGERMKPILGAAVAAFGVNLVLVPNLFARVAGLDMSAGLVPGWLGLLIVSALGAFLLDWVNQSIGNPLRSAVVIAASQIFLVDIHYVLNGNRGLAAAVASAVVLLAGYCAAGYVYGKLSNS